MLESLLKIIVKRILRVYLVVTLENVFSLFNTWIIKFFKC